MIKSAKHIYTPERFGEIRQAAGAVYDFLRGDLPISSSHIRFEPPYWLENYRRGGVAVPKRAHINPKAHHIIDWIQCAGEAGDMAFTYSQYETANIVFLMTLGGQRLDLTAYCVTDALISADVKQMAEHLGVRIDQIVVHYDTFGRAAAFDGRPIQAD